MTDRPLESFVEVAVSRADVRGSRWLEVYETLKKWGCGVRVRGLTKDEQFFSCAGFVICADDARGDHWKVTRRKECGVRLRVRRRKDQAASHFGCNPSSARYSSQACVHFCWLACNSDIFMMKR